MALRGSTLALSVCSLRSHPPLPVRKDFPRSGENVTAGDKKGESGKADRL